jgi:hypothetical protein
MLGSFLEGSIISSGLPTIQELSHCGSDRDGQSRNHTAPSAVEQVMATWPVYRAV